MNASFYATTPDDIEMTLKITMPLAAWKKIRDSLGDANSVPARHLKDQIRGMVFLAEKSFLPAPDAKPE